MRMDWWLPLRISNIGHYDKVHFMSETPYNDKDINVIVLRRNSLDSNQIYNHSSEIKCFVKKCSSPWYHFINDRRPKINKAQATRQNIRIKCLSFYILLFQVQDLQVMRHIFEGVRVTGIFILKSVIVKKTPSMAFSFDYIKDFSIMGGRFDRVSMWGFKLENCDEFNALGQSR